MKEISSEVAFSMLDTWAKSSVQLQATLIRKGTSEGSPALTVRIFPKLRSVSFVILDDAGQKIEWTPLLTDCDFSLGESPEEGRSCLVIDFPDETRVIVAERLVDI
jgi:hypothetical protein